MRNRKGIEWGLGKRLSRRVLGWIGRNGYSFFPGLPGPIIVPWRREKEFSEVWEGECCNMLTSDGSDINLLRTACDNIDLGTNPLLSNHRVLLLNQSIAMQYCQ